MMEQEKRQTSTTGITSAPSTISDEQAIRLAQQLSNVLRQCQQAQTTLDRCNANDNEAMQQATVQLTMCMAQVVCPLQHAALMECIQDDDASQQDESMEIALDTTTTCVANFFEKVQVAKQQHQHLFASEKGKK
jgi:hypothetical protein